MDEPVTSRTLIGPLFLALVICVSMTSVASAQPAPELTGWTGTIYVGAYPNRIFVIDEATEQVVDEIRMTLDGPPNALILSEDGTRFYLRDRTYEQIEVIDVWARRSIDTLTLSDGTTKVRIRSFRVAPDHSYIILLIDAATKLVDRFEIAPRTLVQVDLETYEVVREIAWPDDEERISVNMLFSPNGDLLYLFGQEIIALDTVDFQEIERWQLSQLEEGGLGRFDFGFRVDVNEEPGFFSGVFRVQDPVQNRSLMGIARINLADRDIDFYTLGPAERVSSFSVAPGRQKAYGLLEQIGHHEFWIFDLAGRRLENRQVFDGRPHMRLSPSTNGQILYVYGAGNTIDLYEAATCRFLRTITIDGDMRTIFLVPE